jgi:hypothetical protein
VKAGEQAGDTPADLVADRPYGFDTLPGRVVQLPVQVALAGEGRAGVTAAHGDHHVRVLHHFDGEDLRNLSGDVDTGLAHRLHNGRVDRAGGRGASGADLIGSFLVIPRRTPGEGPCSEQCS